MNTLTLLVLAGVAIWAYKPLRVFLIQRTNRTVKVLLVVMPALVIGRIVYNFSQGKQDDMTSAALLMIALLAIWGLLIWLGNVLEKRRPTKVQGPDLAALSKLPGMPRIPTALTSPAMQSAMTAAKDPEVQRVARQAGQTVMRAAVRTAAQVDTKDVAGSLGRISGRWVARARKSMAPGPSRG